MKLYRREDFIKLPKNTIYSRINGFSDQELMNGLFCKVSSPEDWTNDYSEQELIAESGFPNNIDDGLEAMQHQLDLRNNFKDFKTDLHCSCRDGYFDDEELLVVWDKNDVEKLFVYLGDVLKEM